VQRFLLAGAVFGAFIAPALGADMPLKAPAPPPTPWSGWYVGLSAGYESSGAKIDTGSTNTYASPNDGNFGPSLASAITQLSNFNASAINNGFIGGGQIGGNWQFEKIWVAGIEADIGGVASSQSSHAFGSTLVLPIGGSVVQSASVSRALDYLGTVRGRLGLLFGPSLLFYGTVGLAYGDVSASTSIAQNVFGHSHLDSSVWAGAGAYSGTLVGWTGGAGAEWMFLPSWSTRVEYLHYDLGAGNYGVSPLVSNERHSPFTVNALESNARFNGDVIRAGLNYHF
jgi:outer membrane immunogenic protein